MVAGSRFRGARLSMAEGCAFAVEDATRSSQLCFSACRLLRKAEFVSRAAWKGMYGIGRGAHHIPRQFSL